MGKVAELQSVKRKGFFPTGIAFAATFFQLSQSDLSSPLAKTGSARVSKEDSIAVFCSLYFPPWVVLPITFWLSIQDEKAFGAGIALHSEKAKNKRHDWSPSRLLLEQHSWSSLLMCACLHP